MAADLVKQAKEDSLAQALQKGKSDSAAADMAGRNSRDSLKLADKARQDSLLMANRANKDSLALQDSQKKLAEEKSKLSEAEKQLLYPLGSEQRLQAG